MKRKERKEIQEAIEETAGGSFYVTKEGDIGKCLGRKQWQCQNCIFDGGVNSIDCLEKRLKWLNEEIFDITNYILGVSESFLCSGCVSYCDDCSFLPKGYDSCEGFLTEVLEKGLKAMGY